MGLSNKQQTEVKKVLITALRRKFHNYNPEPSVMPFHTRLLGKDRLALYSFIHSLSTNFGSTIFEPVAIAIAKNRFKIAQSQFKPETLISERALYSIQKIMDNLLTATVNPNKMDEIKTIRAVCQSGRMRKVKLTKVDLFLETASGHQYMFDIKTAKPNAGGFKEFKRTLLEWVASTLGTNPKVNIHTAIAIPYNPYEPQPYNRWTMRGMLDLNHELKVGDEFWDFLGGKDTYQDLLDCFEQVGIELRDEIDEYFSNFQNGG